MSTQRAFVLLFEHAPARVLSTMSLDFGVKVNYLKHGPAMKKIVELDAKRTDMAKYGYFYGCRGTECR